MHLVPGAVARDSRGRFVARARPALYGRKAERAAARAERAMLAPWRAGIKRARLIKRLLMSQKRTARDAARGEGERAAAARWAAADGGAGVGGGKAHAAPVEKHGHGLLQRGAAAAGGLVGGARSVGGLRPGGALGQKGRVEELGRGPLQRGAVGVAGSARMGKHDKDPTPMERLPGAGLGGGAAGVAGSAGGLGSVGGLRPGGALEQKGRVEELGRGPLQRGAVEAAGSARVGKPDKDPTPMERLPDAGLGARAAGIAAATAAGDAGTAAGRRHPGQRCPTAPRAGAGSGCNGVSTRPPGRSGEGKQGQGFAPDPTKGRCPLEPRQGQRPLEPFSWSGEREGGRRHRHLGGDRRRA